MTFSWVGACGACVVFVKAKTMSPTVEHLGTIIGRGQTGGGDSNRGCRRCGGSGLIRGSRIGAVETGLGRIRGSRIGAVEAGLASGETSKAFFVGRIEECLEFSQGLVGGRAGKPGFTGMGEHTSGFKEEVGKVDGDGICDGVSASGSDASDFAETFPQQFDWLSRGPQCADAGPVLLKIGA